MFIKEEYEPLFSFYIDLLWHIPNGIKESDDILSKDILKISNYTSGNTHKDLEIVNKEVENITKQFALPKITNLCKVYNCGIEQDYSSGYLGVIEDDPDYISYAYYVLIKFNKDIVNASEDMVEKLSKITIRVANHLSRTELRGINNPQNIRLFHNYMINLTNTTLTTYVTNILATYSNFLNHLEDYTILVNNLRDIDNVDIQLIKKYQVQGNFPELT